MDLDCKQMDIRTLCLGVLTLKDATGYEIKKMCEEGALCHFLDASFGSIYPALSKLTEEGLVSCREESQPKRPDKKVYSITETGRVEFRAALQRPLLEDKYRSDFLFVSLFADQLPPGHMHQLIDNQITWLKQQAEHMSDGIRDSESAGAQFVSGFGQASTKAIIEYLEQHRRSLETAAQSTKTVTTSVTEDA